MKLAFIIFGFLLLLSCCNKKEEKYIKVSGYVYEAYPVHQGGRRFKLHVRYKFFYNNRWYKQFDNFKLGDITSPWIYTIGDKISIEFPDGHPENSRGSFNH